MSNPLDFLEGGNTSEPEPATVPAAEPAPEPQAAETAPEAPQDAPERPRGPDGKFIPSEPKDASTAPPDAPATPLTDKELGGTLKALLDTRDRAQAAERERDELRAWRAAQEPGEPQSFEAAMEARLYAQNLTVSRRFAERQYGKEAVAEVHDWAAAKCNEDPAFNQQMRSSDDPYEAAMQARNRDQIASEVTPEAFAQFKAWKASQPATPATPPPPVAASPPPPRSLANASGTGAVGQEHVPTGEGNAYAAAFPT